MRCPMCSVSFILGPVFGLHLGMLSQPQTVTTLCSVTISFVVFQPIPSLHLIYHSFLRTVVQ